MLNIDQVKLLETKVAGAVELIKNLSNEKETLKKEVELRDAKISELEALLANFKEDQTQIEEKVISALNQLSAFEDSVYENKSASSVDNVEPTGLKDKIESSNVKTQSNLQKDLADVLGTPANNADEPEVEANTESDDDADQQLDIF